VTNFPTVFAGETHHWNIILEQETSLQIMDSRVPIIERNEAATWNM
jgi:hypothetical protein